MNLAEFLLARIAEDEAVARAGDAADVEYPAAYVSAPFGARDGDVEIGRYLERFSPARVLAECKSKRQIVESCAQIIADEDGYFATLGVPEGAAIARHHLRILAAVYADHPDYDPRWSVQ